MRVVATRREDRFEFDAARTLFTFPNAPSISDHDGRAWAVTADGQRILAATIPEQSVPRRIEIVTDWTTELARVAPAD